MAGAQTPSSAQGRRTPGCPLWPHALPDPARLHEEAPTRPARVVSPTAFAPEAPSPTGAP